MTRVVTITTISQYRAIDEHNRRGMQQPQQPRYFRVFFYVRLRPSHFTLCACVLNFSKDNNVYHADLYSGSVNLHLTSLNRQRMREIDWSCAITCFCPSGKVMYICENRLSCPRKAKSVLADQQCVDAEPLKVALKVKMISIALHYISLRMNQPFEHAVEWTVKDSLKDRSLTSALWWNNETGLTDSLSRTKYIRLQPADRGGAAPGAGLHVSPCPQCFSLVSDKVMTSTPR